MNRGRLDNTGKRLLQVAHRLVHGTAAESRGNAARVTPRGAASSAVGLYTLVEPGLSHFRRLRRSAQPRPAALRICRALSTAL